MRRLFSAHRALSTAAPAVVAALAVLAGPPMGTGALAQTVGDYEAALTAVPIGADAETPCLALGNYTFVSIPPDERIGPLTLFGAVGAIGMELDPVEVASAEQRRTCTLAGRQPVITFDGGLGEDIVAEPVMEDPNRPWIDQSLIR